MEKVLIITYYWPPSGGAGVQRWVKMVKYLSGYDFEIHVITVDEQYASYLSTDLSLIADIPDNVHIHKTRSFEPINIYGKIFGKSKIPTAGFSNVDNSSWTQKAANFLRSNLFIPDPRRCWNHFAKKKALELIKSKNIGLLITSSPPHSTQLIGYQLKCRTGIRWIADLRDPWTDIYYYRLLNHSRISQMIDHTYEQKTLEHADVVLTVSPSLKELFQRKYPNLSGEKFFVIPNGFDPADFKESRIEENHKKFIISYTGSMSLEYNPQSFLSVLSGLLEDAIIKDIEINFYGNVHQKIRQFISGSPIKDHTRFIPRIPHDEIIHRQLSSHVLLLIIPDVDHAEGILTGKLFEYLATGNRIICLGPKHGDAARIIEDCEAGATFERTDERTIRTYLIDLYQQFEHRHWVRKVSLNVLKYSRTAQANELNQLLQHINEK